MRPIVLAFLFAVLALPAAVRPERGLPHPARRPARDHRARGRDAEPAGAGAARRPHLGAARGQRQRRRPHRRRGRGDHRRPARLELRRAPERLRLGDHGERAPARPSRSTCSARSATPAWSRCEPGTTLLQAIALAGGLDRFAATKRIQLRRTDPATGQERLYLFNYNAVERGGVDPVDDHAARGRRDPRSRTPPLRVKAPPMRRRLSLAAALLAGTAAAALGVAGTVGQDGRPARPGQARSGPGPAPHRALSERSPPTATTISTTPRRAPATTPTPALVLGFDRNTATQTFALGLDTGLRALWEAQQNFEFTVASPTGAQHRLHQRWAGRPVRRGVRYRQRQVDFQPIDTTGSRGRRPRPAARATPASCATTPTSASPGAPARPSSYELRFLGNQLRLQRQQHQQGAPAPRSEGQGTWNLQLNPVFASQVFGSTTLALRRRQRPPTTELAVADRPPASSTSRTRTSRSAAASATPQRKRGHRRPTTCATHPGQHRPGGPRRLRYRSGQLHLLRRPALHHRGARIRSSAATCAASTSCPRGQLSGRVFQSYAGTDSGGQEARVTGVGVGLLHEHQRGLELRLDAAYATQVDVDDTLNPTGPTSTAPT